MKGNNDKVTSLGGRCCDVRAAAKRNAEQMKTGAKDKEEYVGKKYKSYSDLLA